MIRALLLGYGKHEGCGALGALVRRVIVTDVTFGFEKVNRLRDYHGQTPKFVKKTARGSRILALARIARPLIVRAVFSESGLLFGRNALLGPSTEQFRGLQPAKGSAKTSLPTHSCCFRHSGIVQYYTQDATWPPPSTVAP